MKPSIRLGLSVLLASALLFAASAWLAQPSASASAPAAPAAACTVSWNTDSDGDWNTASNWSTGLVPGTGDDVCIDRISASPVITLSTDASVHSLSNNESIRWFGGTLSVTVGATNTGLITLAG